MERAECALIWHAEQQNNEIIDFRADTSAMALLGLRLVTAPRVEMNGSSREHVIGYVYNSEQPRR